MSVLNALQKQLDDIRVIGKEHFEFRGKIIIEELIAIEFTHVFKNL